jgi:predicted aldo/keto reductase-like oxidoreductase
MSSKTPEGGLRAVQEMDVVMATCNPDHSEDIPVLEAAAAANKGVLIKKGLQSGHVGGPEGVARSMEYVFSQPGVSSMIVGTINPNHLQDNVKICDSVVK